MYLMGTMIINPILLHSIALYDLWFDKHPSLAFMWIILLVFDQTLLKMQVKKLLEFKDLKTRSDDLIRCFFLSKI